MVLMTTSTRLQQCEEKKPLEAWPQDDETDKEFGVEQFAQLTTDMLIHGMNVRDFEPNKLESQLRELARNYTSYSLCRYKPRPTISCSTQPAEQEDSPNDRHGSTHLEKTQRPSKEKVHYFDHNWIVLQRIHNGNLWDRQSTLIPDQGIQFDKDDHSAQ